MPSESQVSRKGLSAHLASALGQSLFTPALGSLSRMLSQLFSPRFPSSEFMCDGMTSGFISHSDHSFNIGVKKKACLGVHFFPTSVFPKTSREVHVFMKLFPELLELGRLKDCLGVSELSVNIIKLLTFLESSILTY